MDPVVAVFTTWRQDELCLHTKNSKNGWANFEKTISIPSVSGQQ